MHQKKMETNLLVSGDSSEKTKTVEQEAGLKYFERAKKMEAAAINLREVCSAMSEPYPDIDENKRREIDAIFERITDLIISDKNPNVEQLFLQESGDIYWDKLSERLQIDSNTLRKLLERSTAEIMLHIFLDDISDVFGLLTNDDMHHVWFYNQIGEKLPDSLINFDEWMKLNGVPAVFSGNLVMTQELWNKKIGSNSKTLGEMITGLEYGRGRYFTPSDFDSSNPFEVLGLSILKEQHADGSEPSRRQMMLTALHESSHQIDFYLRDRKGDDFFISEILAFRTRLWASSADRKSDEDKKFESSDLIRILQNVYLKKKTNETEESFEFRKKKIEEAVKAFTQLEERFDAAVVQHILLNCLTLDDLISWSFKLENDEDIEKYLKWKNERST